MDFGSNIDLIIRDLTEVCEIIDDLKHYHGVPSFQVEIAKSKCRSAAELIALLKTMKEPEPLNEAVKTVPPHVTESKQEEPKKILAESPAVITMDESIPIEANIVEITKDKIAVPELHTSAKILHESEKAEISAKPAKTEKSSPRKDSEKISEAPMIADRFSPVSNSLYEQIGSQISADDLTDIIKAKPVSSLTEAIGLSDKFLFISELFNGDKDAYQHAISKLDSAENYADARAFLMSLSEKGEETEAIKQLLMIVKRKHPSNE
jgi:hypothetical protein